MVHIDRDFGGKGVQRPAVRTPALHMARGRGLQPVDVEMASREEFRPTYLRVADHPLEALARALRTIARFSSSCRCLQLLSGAEAVDALLVAERDHRVNPRGATAGYKARGKRNCEEENRDRRESDRITR